MYERIFGFRPLSFTIVPLRATGDFEGKGTDPRAVMDIYLRLSTGGATLPPTVGFSFDRERKSDAKVADLEKTLGGLARFLPRAMIENYFLDPDAIGVLLQVRLSETFSTSLIQAALEEALSLPKIVPGGLELKLENIDTMKLVDGALVVCFIIDKVTGSRYKYRKVQDGPVILNWLTANKPDHVVELCNFAASLFASAHERVNVA